MQNEENAIALHATDQFECSPLRNAEEVSGLIMGYLIECSQTPFIQCADLHNVGTCDAMLYDDR